MGHQDLRPDHKGETVNHSPLQGGACEILYGSIRYEISQKRVQSSHEYVDKQERARSIKYECCWVRVRIGDQMEFRAATIILQGITSKFNFLGSTP